MIKLEVGKIYRIRDLDNNVVRDSLCVHEVQTLNGEYFCWTMHDKNGLETMIDIVDNVRIEAKYDDWPEPCSADNVSNESIQLGGC